MYKGITEGFAEYLSRNNIDVISSDSITLKSSDKVQLVINTLKYLMNENDNIAKLNLSFYQNINKDVDIYNETKKDKERGGILQYTTCRTYWGYGV